MRGSQLSGVGSAGLLEFSLAADDPASILPVWDAYPQVRNDDPLAGGAPRANSLPNREWLGRPLAISDFISDREFRRRGLYAEVCKPLGVRAVMKVFLPTGRATGASLAFDTTRSRFTETDRRTLERLVPHLGQPAAGETNTVIAQALFVSPGTVRKHLEHVYDKLEVRTRTQAAAIYTRERVVMESPGLDP